MRTYEKLTLTDGKTVILRDAAEIEFLGAACMTGVEVGSDGDEKAPIGIDERRHIIQRSLIRRSAAMRMNLKYGTLERV